MRLLGYENLWKLEFLKKFWNWYFLISRKIYISDPNSVGVEKREILSHWRKFRQINSLVKPLLSRNFCQKCVREIFCNFHTVEIYPTWKNFREINLQYNSLIEKLLWRNFCKKDCGEKLFKFPHCVIVNYPN